MTVGDQYRPDHWRQITSAHDPRAIISHEGWRPAAPIPQSIRLNREIAIGQATMRYHSTSHVGLGLSVNSVRDAITSHMVVLGVPDNVSRKSITSARQLRP